MNNIDLLPTSSTIRINNIRHNNMYSSTPSVSSPASSSASSSVSSTPLCVTTNTSKNNEGYLELILGPMFSGKTSTLKKIYDQCMKQTIDTVMLLLCQRTTK